VTWEATGGTISGAGQYVAGDAPGTYRVIARGPQNLADTATVTINQNPPVPSQLTVTPQQVGLLPGETRGFEAALRDQYGDPISGTVTWEATGGTISGAGQYVAGDAPGTYRVIARGPQNLADTATVTISPSTTTEVRYVDAQAGSNSNDGRSPTSALATLSEALRSLPGDGGTIRTKGTFSLTSPWSISKPVSVEAYGATTIQPGAEIWTLVLIEDVSGVSLEGLTLTGTAGIHDATDLVRVYDSQAIEIRNLDLQDANGSGVAGARVHELTVQLSNFSDLGLSGVRADDSGVTGVNSHWTIVDNSFIRIDQRKLAGHAAVQSNGFSLNEWFWVERNHIENSQAGTVGIGLDAVTHAWVRDNYIRGSGDGGLGEGIALTGQDITVTGNEVHESAAAGILVWASSWHPTADVLIADNVVYDNEQGIALVWADNEALLKNIEVRGNRAYWSGSAAKRQHTGIQTYQAFWGSPQQVTAEDYENVHIFDNDLRGNADQPLSIWNASHPGLVVENNILN
jgi:hypothetical protein